MTGASRGIGAACALALAERGHDLALTYARDREGAERVAERVRGLGRRAHVERAEAREPGSVERAVASSEEALGPLDAVVANAGLTRDGPAVRMGGEAWSDPLAVNLTGSFAALRAALAGMARRGAGAAVAISSVVGLQGNVGQANYAATKAGLLGLVRSLARELGPAGVRVNAVAPGYVVTRLTDALSAQQRERLLAATPLGRLGEPGDVAGPVVFLCSPAAAFITGAVLSVDGGLRL